MEKFLAGKKIYLRGLRKEDCNSNYLAFVNDSEALAFASGIGYKPISAAGLEAYVENCNNSSDLLLGIFENKTNAHVGNIHLSQIHPYHRSCLYGIILYRKYMGKGYAYEASKLLIKHAFEKMNMNRIHINCIEKNRKAIKLYKGLGAVEEGIAREAFYYEDRYIDIVVYAILKKDYLKNKGKK